MALIRIQSHPLSAALCLGAVLLLMAPNAAAQTTEWMWKDTTLAETLIETSRQFNRDDEHQAALAKARQALEIYTQLYGAGHVKTAKAQMYVARELRNTDQPGEAAILFGQSLRSYETAGDTFRIALCHQNLGLCLQAMRRYPEAMQHARTAIACLRQDSARQASTLADFYVTIGSVYNDEKKYLSAIPVLEASKAVYTQTKREYALGLVSYHIGNAYFGLNDFTRAKENYLTAMANLKQTLKPSHSYFADLYVKIGLCYQKTDEAETGLALMLEAKEAYLKSGKEHPNYIAFLQRLGQFYLAEKQYSGAIEQMELCLAAKEKRYGEQSTALISTLLGLGEACQEAGEFVRAETFYRRGLYIAGDWTDGRYNLRFRFYGKLAELRFVQGDYSGSLTLCDTAFAVAGFDPERPGNVLPRDFFRELCQICARSLMEQFRLTADTTLLLRAERCFSLAAATLHRELDEITVNSSKEILYDRDHPVLQQWLEARMKLFEATANPEHAEMAFQIAGQSKAFLLAEAMRRSGALRYAGVPDSILQSELSLRENIVTAEKKLDTLNRHRSARMASAALAINLELSGTRAEYDALHRRIEKTYPDYFRLRNIRHDIPTEQLRQNWLAPDQALLMYSLTDAHVFVFVLTRDTFCTATLPLDFPLEDEIKQLRKYLTGYHTEQDPPDALYDTHLDAYIVLAQSLYQKLVLPVASLLPARVVVVPEGALCYLPFEALLTGAPADAGNFRSYPFWIREKAVSYSLSTDYLVETAMPGTRKFEKHWLGLAPFAGNNKPGIKETRGVSNEHFMPLPYSGTEVGAIAALLQGEVWLDAAARPGRFRTEAARYRILHLATHSRADDRLGDFSFLAVSNAGAPLPAKDLYQFSLAADMVVLSACETGGGKLHRGEGIIGMVRAFTFAGARSIVASLWVAHDQCTAGLMLDYYRNLLNGLPKDVAMQEARLQRMELAPADAHPFFWAGFRVFGNVEPLWQRQ